MALLLASLAPLFLLAAPAGAQVTKLSAPLPPPTGSHGGPVLESDFTADGAWVVYRAPQDEASTQELYSAPADASQPARKLSGALAVSPLHAVLGFRLDPTSTWVAFHVGYEGGTVSGTYAARVDGSGTPVPLGAASSYAFTPDGTRLLLAQATALEARAVDGSGTPLVLDPLGARAVALSTTPDGAYVLYLRRVQVQVSGQSFLSQRLFRVSTEASSAPLQLSTSTIAHSSVEVGLRLTPDGEHVVYRCDAEVYGRKELFRVPLAGGTPLKLNAPLASNSTVRQFELSASTGRAVYVASVERSRPDLYSVPLTGGASTRLSPPLGSSGDVVGVPYTFRIAPDGRRVLFSARLAPGQLPSLYVASLNGAPRPRRLTTPISATGSLSIATYAWSPDSTRALYTTNGDDPAVVELFSERLDGPQMRRAPAGPPARVKLNAPLVPGGNVLEFALDPDGAHVLYRADQDVDEVAQLYSAPLAGTQPPQRVSAPLVPGGDVLTLAALDSGGTRALYYADGEQDETIELFAAPLAGGVAVKLNGELDPGTPYSEVDQVRLAPGGAHAVYQQQDRFSGQTIYALQCVDLATGTVANVSLGSLGQPQDSSVRFAPDGARLAFTTIAGFLAPPRQLYSAPVDGSLPPLLLNAPLGTGEEIARWAFTPDGAAVVFQVFGSSPSVSALFAAPADGSSSALLLDSQLHAIQLPHPDGQHVAYHAGSERDLYLARLDGSLPPVRLVDATLPRGPTRFVSAPFAARFTPDGTRIVFCDELEIAGEFELYSVSTSAGLPPLELSGTLVPGGDVGAFELAAGGTLALYLADGNVDGRTELYSVPVDGSSGPVVISGSPGSSSVTRFLLSPDGTQVAFVRGVLYLAPVDGSAAPLAAGLGVSDSAGLGFSPDGAYVLVQQFDRLLRVPTDGSGPPLQLNASLDSLSSASPGFLVSADSRWVVYRSTPAIGDETVHLYASALDGLSPPVRLDVAIPDKGGCVGPSTELFTLTPDSLQVLYLGDHERGTISELFVAPLP